jgi:hypothetical protein
VAEAAVVADLAAVAAAHRTVVEEAAGHRTAVVAVGHIDKKFAAIY